MIKHLLTALIFFTLLITEAHAEWFEVRGTAQIHNGDVPTARQEAIDDALRQVMLESGSFVTSSQNVSGGVVTDDSFNVASANNIRQYTLMSEKRENGFIYVQVRVFVESNPGQCLGASWKKSVLPLLFTYDTNQYQESIHGMEGINVELAKRFTAELATSGGVISKSFYNKNLGIDPLRHTTDSAKLDTTLRQLSRSLDVQYIVTGVVRDLSRSRPDDGWFNKQFGDDLRQFSFSIYVFDGLTGEQIYTNDYHTVAVWNLDSDKPSVQSREFWSSSYGKEVAILISRASRDAAQVIGCQKPVARIIKVDPLSGEVYINLGKNSNLKQGTRFYIEHSGMFTDQNGEIRFTRNRARSQMEAIEIYQNSALLKPIGNDNGNIQLDDLAFIE